MGDNRKKLMVLLLSELMDEKRKRRTETSTALILMCLHDSKRNRILNFCGDVATKYRPDEFKLFFRVRRATVEILYMNICEVATEHNNAAPFLERVGSGGRDPVPLQTKLLLFLWYLASQDKYSSVADRFGTSEYTVCNTIRQLALFFSKELLSKFISWPNQDEMLEMSSMYEDTRNFPGVRGMIDGCHIPIEKPADRGIDYYNRKSFYSVVLQGVVREDLRFIDILCGWPGKVHDARIFRKSPLFLYGEEKCDGGHLLGDSAYPNIKWLLSPYRDNGHLTEAQRKFNVAHAQIRSTVERAFGLLKGRFKRLKYINQHNIETINYTVTACCILHNICIINDDDVSEYIEENDAGPHNVVQPGDFNDWQDEGARKRFQIARRIALT